MPVIRSALLAIAAVGILGACRQPTVPPTAVLLAPETPTRMAEAAARPTRAGRLGLSGTAMPETPQVADAAIRRELDRIANRLRTGDRTASFPQIDVIATVSRAYEAELSLDGQILLSLGLLAKAGTEDEIAFVVAHEMGHRMLGHQTERQATLRALRQAIALGTSAVAYGAAMRVGPQRQARPGEGRGNVLLGAVMTAPILHALAAEIGDALYSRDQEVEADRFGFDLLVRARYTPGAIGAVFNQLEADERGREARIANLRGTAT